jgi:hypothetical protein
MNDSGPSYAQRLFSRFHDLMPHRVREVLLVSSLYDSFILEEDGPLTERIFTEYSELNLSTAPRITHASTPEMALELLSQRRFDLVMTMVRLGDVDVTAFGRSIKERDPRIPIVVLALTEADLRPWSALRHPPEVDHVFLWTGDTQILLAIIKQVEDRLNVAHDTRAGDVRVILIVEDSVRRYSHLLSVLYAELMAQSQSLSAEGLNDQERLARMRARPKLLLERTYEGALGTYRAYRDHLVAVIADMRFPKDGQENPTAGLDLVRMIRSDLGDITVLLQSAEPKDARWADEIDTLYLDKNDNVLRQIRNFVVTNLGFGDFLFRSPDGRELARAHSVFEMEAVLETLPAESLAYHASRNHISLWLAARCMFDLAKRVRAWRIEDFGGAEGTRRELLALLRQTRMQDREGVIADVSAGGKDRGRRLVRLGSGSIGGKGRGVAFIHLMLARAGLSERFPGLEISAPRTVVIGTDPFDRFLIANALHDCLDCKQDDPSVVRRFLDGTLPMSLERQLREVMQDLHGPLAVRSSSLLEDSHAQPFAGIYATYMIPNTHPDPEVRFHELCRAIRAVYASTYGENARAYIAGTSASFEEEKMGVVIQEMVGKRRGDRFYPSISGVALSYNDYPVGTQRAEEGVAVVGLGLGQMIVQGGATLQFSPALPSTLPPCPEPRDFLANGQTEFLALDMSKDRVDFLAGPESNLGRFGLDAAEEDGTLAVVGSVYVASEDRLRENLSLPGPRVVTVHNILKWKAIPLAPALELLLQTFRQALGCAVEIEFAVDMGDYGRNLPRGQPRTAPRLHVLQVRPQGAGAPFLDSVELQRMNPDEVLCSSTRALGHGVLTDLRDIIHVNQRNLDRRLTPAVAREIGLLNARLEAEGRGYVLIGPGRWGTMDPGLGIPVSWSQISAARVMVELDLAGRGIEPSQGTHFFHNIVSFGVGYLWLGSSSDLDEDWLAAQEASSSTQHVRHVRLSEPLTVYLNGREGLAAIRKPALPSSG